MGLMGDTSCECASGIGGVLKDSPGCCSHLLANGESENFKSPSSLKSRNTEPMEAEGLLMPVADGDILRTSKGCPSKVGEVGDRGEVGEMGVVGVVGVVGEAAEDWLEVESTRATLSVKLELELELLRPHMPPRLRASGCLHRVIGYRVMALA